MVDDLLVAEGRRIWRAWERDGLEGVLATVPDDVEWRPATAHGRALYGKQALREFARDRGAATVRVQLFDVEPAGDRSVILTGALRCEEPGTMTTMQVAWVLAFLDGRLRRVSGHASLAEARQVASELDRAMSEADLVAPEDFRVGVSHRRGRTTIAPEGDLDVETAPFLVGELDRLPAGTTELVLDLGGVPYMDSSGLRVLFEAFRCARREGRRLVIRPGPHAVRRVLAVSGADRVLPLELVG